MSCRCLKPLGRAEVLDLPSHIGNLPPEQQAIQDRCFHPSGTFIEFHKSAIEQSIPSRFEEQVRRYPGRVALKTEKEELPFAALNKAANRVAHEILARDTLGEKPVALLFDQAALAIVGILGTLRAGKTYVPLEPSIARPRTDPMLGDSQASLIVTNDPNLSLALELTQPTDRGPWSLRVPGHS